MTRIQQVCWRLEMDYLGHPYYVTGNAIYHALGRELPRRQQRAIHASHGMFAPGNFGSYPEEHTKSRAHPSMGASLTDIEAYDDLFLHRHPAQGWLLDSRPRDALNTHGIRTQAGHPAVAHEMRLGRPETAPSDARKTTWFVHAYLHADERDILPVDICVLDGLQFGGKRNYGYGTVQLHDTQMVDLDRLDYTRLAEADHYRLELVTPFVLSSEYPGTTTVEMPWWWETLEGHRLRRREECIVEGDERFQVRTIDHGQIIEYTGDRPVETAKAGLARIGSHSKYGFGELRVRPISGGEGDLMA